MLTPNKQNSLDRSLEDKRNVIDYYKYFTVDAIKADLDVKRHDFSVLVTNKFKDFNLGTVIRNANAFLAKEVIIYGSKHYDRRGAVGTYNYENIKIVKYVEELDFPSPIIGIDNIPRAKPIETFEWPKGPLTIVFGQEDIGIPDEILEMCDHVLYITQYGSTRSLNVGCASAIAMYDYTKKMIAKNDI